MISKLCSCCSGQKNKVSPDTLGKRPANKWIFSDDVEGAEEIKDNLNAEYDVGYQLGQPGQFGVAYECIRISDKEEFAVKRIEKIRFIDASIGISDYDRALYYQQFRDEIKMMQAMDHPNIVKLIDVIEDADSLYLVMEKCSGGELFDRIKRKQKYSEKDAAAVLIEFARGIEAMHDKEIAHCDLKPDNILFLTEDENAPLKIIDFGMSKHSPNGNNISGFRGTPYYVAPEIVERKNYTYHCDMWSFGVISFVMLFGFPPFHSRSGEDEEIYRKIKEGFCPEVKGGFGPWFPMSTQITDAARDLITRCLELDPVKRYTATEVLEHPWVTGQAASGEPLVRQVLKNLDEFTAGCKLKAAVLDVMTDILTDVEITHLKQTFNAIDRDGDGQITADELKDAVKKSVNQEKDNVLDHQRLEEIKNFQQIIAMADVNGDGKLSYNELLATCVQRKMKLKQERMLAAFKKFDKDGDGQITFEEIKEMLSKNGQVITDEDAKAIVAEVDTDKDGVISEEEFLAMWNRSQQYYVNSVLGDDKE